VSKRHTDRRKVAAVSAEAERLAAVSCLHADYPCDNCRRQCQRDIEDSQARARRGGS
jgi:uncharacterized protein (DUF3084 family)